jgi:D-amino peptidase
MKRNFLLALFVIAILAGLMIVSGAQQKGKGLKVFISVDMEGVCGVINWEDVSRDGKDYPLFRRLMTLETNAAIEGAIQAGATEIIVRDAHGSARNILPDLLNKEAQLIRDWSDGPKSMMEGIDDSFDAAIFVGYHARAGTPDATLEHTMTGAVYDLKINDILMPEAGVNALIAGMYNVPVVMVAGDRAITDQVKELFGDIETATVKWGIGQAARMLHPEKACDLIKEKTYKALKRIGDFKPYKLKPPYTIEIAFTSEERANKVALIPYAERTGNRSVSFKSDDLMMALRFFEAALDIR